MEVGSEDGPSRRDGGDGGGGGDGMGRDHRDRGPPNDMPPNKGGNQQGVRYCRMEIRGGVVETIIFGEESAIAGLRGENR